jgi:hypothetical protein
MKSGLLKKGKYVMKVSKTTYSRWAFLIAGGLLALGLAWPVTSCAQDKPDPANDPAKHAQHQNQPADAKTDMASQIAELTAKVERLQAALEKSNQSAPSRTNGMGAMQGKGMGQMPQDKGMGQMPQGKGMGQMPQGKGMGQMPQGKGMGQMPQDKSMGQMPQDKSMGSMGGQAPAPMGMDSMMGGMMKGMDSMMGAMEGMKAMAGGMPMDEGMDMMDMMGMGNMGGGMKGKVGQMKMGAALPGFPGTSHIYHVGATGFFLDHPEHLDLSTDQQTQLNAIKQKALLEKATGQRNIDEAEQKLWTLTAAGEPDAERIGERVREIEKLRGDRRLAFIRSVGEAAKVLTDEQRRALLGVALAQPLSGNGR